MNLYKNKNHVVDQDQGQTPKDQGQTLTFQSYQRQLRNKRVLVPSLVVGLTALVGFSALLASNASAPSPTIPLYDAVCSKQVDVTKNVKLSNSNLTEVSGIAASRTTDNAYWVHNDSGDTARIFSVSGASGAVLGTFKINNATATDWEDIDTGPGPVSGQSYIYIADTGDNDLRRNAVQMYRVPEPSPNADGKTITLNNAAKLNLKYPGGAKLNVEAVFVDPVSGKIYLVDKSDTRKAQVFEAPANLANGSTTTVTKVADLGYPLNGKFEKITGADMSQDGNTIAIRSYDHLYVYRKQSADTISAALATPACALPNFSEPQGEAVAFKRSNTGLVTVSEGRSQPLYNFDIRADATAVSPTPTPSVTSNTTSASPPATPPPATATATVPAGLLSLTNWKLTLPIGSSGSPTEIKQTQLATYTVDPWFHLNAAKTAVVFHVNHGGVTTSGSANPRSELREMTNNGTTNASWSSTSGTHSMTIKQSVDHLTTVRPYVVVGQIHDASDDITVFRLEGNKLWITDGDNTHSYLVDGNYQLGTVFTVTFEVSNGVISYYYNGNKLTYNQLKKFSGAYFKAGNYLQSNPSTAPTESTSAYSEVSIYDLRVSHR